MSVVSEALSETTVTGPFVYVQSYLIVAVVSAAVHNVDISA